jgi:hypothetical protein
MICDCCNKEQAVIYIAGEGHFCLKCNNDIMLRRYNVQNDFGYQETIFIYEKEGNLRQFKLHHMILGGIVSWEANEIGGSYQIKDVSYLGDNTAAVISRFNKKIIETIQNKTINKQTDQMFSNLLIRDKTCYSMKEKGNIVIREDEYGNVYFVIDGEEFSPNEFAKMLGGYIGFSMQYQIHDAIDPILAENEMLRDTKIGKEHLA